MRKLFHYIVAVVITVTITSIAHGAVSAYDGFSATDYSLAGISGQNPTIGGFSGAWAGNGSVVDANLTYGNLINGGYAYVRNNGAADRDFDVSPTGPFQDFLNASGKIGSNTLFVSFLMTSPNNTASGFIELQNAGSRAIRLGINNGSWQRRIGGDGWAGLSGVPAVVAGATNLVVFSVDLNEGGARQYYDIWINPTSLGGTAPTPTSEFDTGTLVELDGVMMGLYFSENGVMDELRFGESYADVTPVIPEPALLGSIVLVGGLLLSRKRA